MAAVGSVGYLIDFQGHLRNFHSPPLFASHFFPLQIVNAEHEIPESQKLMRCYFAWDIKKSAPESHGEQNHSAAANEPSFSFGADEE